MVSKRSNDLLFAAYTVSFAPWWQNSEHNLNLHKCVFYYSVIKEQSTIILALVR